MVAIQLPVRQHEDGGTAADRLDGVISEPVESLLHLGRSILRVPDRGDPVREEARIAGPHDPIQLGPGQDRRRQLDERRLLLGLLQQRSPGSEVGPQRHDQLLTDRIHRWVGHLGEELMEVVAEPARRGAEGRQRRVVPHRPGWCLAEGHRLQQHPPILGGVTEHTAERSSIDPLVRSVVEAVLHIQRLCGNPVAEVETLREMITYIRGILHVAGVRVDRDRLARAELARQNRSRLLLRTDARLRGNQQHIGRQRPPRRTQTVAVHAGQEEASIGGGHRSRTIPRLAEEGVILVEGTKRRLHVADVLPCGRNEHLVHVFDASPRPQQQLEGIVETRRVGLGWLHERCQIPRTLAPHRARHPHFPGLHPGAVGADGVDFAVVRKRPEGLSHLPCW